MKLFWACVSHNESGLGIKLKEAPRGGGSPGMGGTTRSINTMEKCDNMIIHCGNGQKAYLLRRLGHSQAPGMRRMPQARDTAGIYLTYAQRGGRVRAGKGSKGRG